MGDYVVVDNNNNLDLTSFTIGAWINPDVETGSVIRKGEELSSGGSYPDMWNYGISLGPSQTGGGDDDWFVEPAGMTAISCLIEGKIGTSAPKQYYLRYLVPAGSLTSGFTHIVCSYSNSDPKTLKIYVGGSDETGKSTLWLKQAEPQAEDVTEDGIDSTLDIATTDSPLYIGAYREGTDGDD